MCGLVGYISSSKHGMFAKELNAFEDMLFVDQLRGVDGTGVCIINNEQGATVLKSKEDYSWLTLDKDFNKTLSDSAKQAKAFLGHNRKATTGKKVDANAHPFVYEDRYVFFHNGTLNNPKTFGDHEVDSESFGSHICPTNGDIEKLGEVFNKAFGAWALVWYDSVEHKIYFVRNSQRPLSFIFLKNGDIAYSSEAWMAYGCVGRNGLLVEKTEAAEENTLYSIDLKQAKLELKKDPLPKKVIQAATKTHRGAATAFTKGGNRKLEFKAGEKLAKKLAQQSYASFIVDDAVSSNLLGGDEDPTKVYDWLISGYNPNFPGAYFTGYLKDKFPYEIENIMGDFMGGYVSDSNYDVTHKQVVVWLENMELFQSSSCLN